MTTARDTLPEADQTAPAVGSRLDRHVRRQVAVGVRETDGGAERYCANADPGGNYDTLCGISLSDDCFERFEAEPKQKITCRDCYELWKTAKLFRRDDFDA